MSQDSSHDSGLSSQAIYIKIVEQEIILGFLWDLHGKMVADPEYYKKIPIIELRKLIREVENNYRTYKRYASVVEGRNTDTGRGRTITEENMDEKKG